MTRRQPDRNPHRPPPALAEPSPDAQPPAPADEDPGAGARLPVGSPQHFRWLHGIVATVLVLNGLDGILTLVWIFGGYATEANPLMDHLLRLHPVAFITVKLDLVGLGACCA